MHACTEVQKQPGLPLWLQRLLINTQEEATVLLLS